MARKNYKNQERNIATQYNLHLPVEFVEHARTAVADLGPTYRLNRVLVEIIALHFDRWIDAEKRKHAELLHGATS